MKILDDIGGINSASYKKFIETLTSSHTRRFRVDVLNKNEKEIGELTLSDRVFVMEGSVQVDASADVTRTLNMVLLDPRRIIFFEPDVPSATALFMDRFIRVTCDVWVPSLTKWVSCPVFTGPITKLEQDGIFVTVEAMGKESLLLAPSLHWRSRTFKKNTRVNTVIRTLLQDKGEARIDLPENNRKLKRPLSVGPRQETWKVINKVAKSIDMHVFYDGAGVFRMRRKPNNVVYVFNYGVELLTNPSQPYDFTTIRNIVQVRGPKPEQKDKKQIIESARLGVKHPMSPTSLGRNGKGRTLVEVIENDHVRKRVRANEQAARVLKRSTTLATEVTFDSMLVPFLDEEDMVAARTLMGIYRFPMRQWTIPLETGAEMSVGFNKRPRMMKRRFRLKPTRSNAKTRSGIRNALPR